MTEKKKAATTAKKTHTEKPAETEAPHAVVVKKSAAKTDSYSKGIQFLEDGKRKNAVARVVLRPGAGKIFINDKYTMEQYFARPTLYLVINKPFKVAQLENQYDVFVNVRGGGKSGQAGAIAHGIAKAIVVINPDLKKQLKIEGLITRDSRVKEAKKYGRKRARKGYTYRKR